MSKQSFLVLSFIATLISAAPFAKASTIYLDGEVNRESVQRILDKAQELSSRGDRNITLSLKSGGGVLTEALRAYPILKALGVNTSAHDDCSSSCTVLFAAGAVRSAAMDTTFEFHQVGIAKKKQKLFGKGLDQSAEDDFRADYANRWTNAIQGASPALAADLTAKGVLLKGRKVYRRGQLRKLGYVNN